jgi:hypothetical protein
MCPPGGLQVSSIPKSSLLLTTRIDGFDEAGASTFEFRPPEGAEDPV